MGAGGAMGLVASASPPEFVYTVLKVPLAAAFVIGVIGFTGAVGVPLPWPFVPRWVVDIRKANRAQRRERRQARKREMEEWLLQEEAILSSVRGGGSVTLLRALHESPHSHEQMESAPAQCAAGPQ